MRTIEHFNQFKRDYKREKKGRHGKSLDELLVPILKALVNDTPLEARHTTIH